VNFRKLSVLFFSSYLCLACSDKTTQDPLDNPKVPGAVTEIKSLQGVVNGGGGKGVICHQNDKSQLEVLDIYEAKTLYNLKLSAFKKDPYFSKDLGLFVSSLYYKHFLKSGELSEGLSKKRIESFNSKKVQPLLNSIKYTEPDQKLNQTNDALEPLLGQNCETVQLAVYYDESILLIDKKLWEELDFLNKAALILHELVYFQARIFGEVNSVKTRKVVGHLFTESRITPVLKGQVGAAASICYLKEENGVISVNEPALFIDNAEEQGVKGVKVSIGPALADDFILFRKSGFIPHILVVDVVSPVAEFQNKYKFEISEETYLNSESIAELKFNSWGETLFSLKNLKRSGQRSHKIKCVDFKDLPDAKKTSAENSYLNQFYATYGKGSFKDESSGEIMVFGKRGKVKILRSRQVGRRDSLKIPYPTTCKYWSAFKVESIVLRSDRERSEYLHEASHELTINQESISLVDDAGNSEACPKLIEDFEPGDQYSIYMELLSYNSFRTHTSGGGGYKLGDPRDGSFGTLDELYVRQD